jgi:toxin YoeB
VKLVFADEAWEDYLYWQKQDKKMVDRINKLIRETQREPFSGVGKPEPLKHALSGFWSRRITDEHRMVYRLEGDELQIAPIAFPLLRRPGVTFLSCLVWFAFGACYDVPLV